MDTDKKTEEKEKLSSEIEVTPEMISAGWGVYTDFNPEYDYISTIVTAVYLAMERERANHAS